MLGEKEANAAAVEREGGKKQAYREVLAELQKRYAAAASNPHAQSVLQSLIDLFTERV